ncbi:CG6059, partial [Drosophila busckii]
SNTSNFNMSITSRRSRKTDKNLSLILQNVEEKEVAQLDLIQDLNQEFFFRSYELIQALMDVDSAIAAKMKRFVDIIGRMHQLYAAEVAEGTDRREQIAEANRKLRLALESTAMSNSMMDELKESVEEAWRTADSVQHRETVRQHSLRQESSAYDHSKNNIEVEHEAHPKELRIRSLVYRERDRLAGEIKDYQKRLEINRYYSAGLEQINENHRTTITKQHNRLKAMEADLYTVMNKNRVNIEHLEEKLLSMRRELEALNQTNAELRVFQRKYEECGHLTEELKHRTDRLTQENYMLQKQNHRLEEEKFQSKVIASGLEHDIKTVQREKESLELIKQVHLHEIKKKADVNALLSRRFMQISKKNQDLIEQESTMSHLVVVVEKKLLYANSKVEEVKRQRDDVTREREKLKVEIVTLMDAQSNLKHDIFNQRNQIQDIQVLLDRANKTLDEKDNKIHHLQKEKAELVSETNDLSKNIEVLEETLQNKNERITTLLERLRLKHEEYISVKKQMELIFSEKAALEKNYTTCCRDRQTVQSLNSKLSFQVNQLTTQLAINEKDMIGLRNQIDQLNSAVKHKLNDIHSRDQQLQRMRVEVHEMKMRSEQLISTIDQDEKRFKQVSCSLEDLKKEKNLVGLQMVRRNDELKLKNEKLSMMQLALDRGTMQYNQRIEDIRLLKLEISNLRSSNSCLERALTQTSNMRQEVVRLERQLNRERLRVTAFTEEMKHPCHIHRWRVTYAKDPKKFELLRKIQLLLKRNIRLGIERSRVQAQLQESERRYEKLKRQLQYVPDRSIVDRLWKQRHITHQQSRKIKAMQAELSINEIDLQARECLIDVFQQTLKDQLMPNKPN